MQHVQCMLAKLTGNTRAPDPVRAMYKALSGGADRHVAAHFCDVRLADFQTCYTRHSSELTQLQRAKNILSNASWPALFDATFRPY